MTMTNTTAAELNETQLDQVVGAGSLMIERKGTAGGNNFNPDDLSFCPDDLSATQTDSAIIVHERKGK